MPGAPYNPKSGFFDAEISWRTAQGPSQPPVFRFEVSPGQRLLYAGSPHVECLAKGKDETEFTCSAGVKDETKRAREIAQAEFAEFGPLVTSLMQRE
ncbi:MAG: hypothetical protein HYU38_06955 [Candidatus Tectomicrobia bacterium]|nr:hypothetical protein [Candidatus Tectomicrobia bacterium]